MNTKKAFTLIELLVVISIIGMLSSIVLVSLQGARTKAINSRILQSASQMRSGFEVTRTAGGYLNLPSSSNGIAYYANLPTDVQKVVNDVIKQQNTTVALGYPGGSASCTNASLSVDANATGVVVTTNNGSCTPNSATEYAIYSASTPRGSAGYTCIDSKGNRASATTGGIVLNTTSGVCSGTSGGGGGGGGGTPVVTITINGTTYASGQTAHLNLGQGDTQFTLSWSSTGGAVSCTYGDSTGNNSGSGPGSGSVSIPIQNFEDGDTIGVTCGSGSSSVSVSLYQ